MWQGVSTGRLKGKNRSRLEYCLLQGQTKGAVQRAGTRWRPIAGGWQEQGTAGIGRSGTGSVQKKKAGKSWLKGKEQSRSGKVRLINNFSTFPSTLFICVFSKFITCHPSFLSLEGRRLKMNPCWHTGLGNNNQMEETAAEPGRQTTRVNKCKSQWQIKPTPSVSTAQGLFRFQHVLTDKWIHVLPSAASD